MSSCGAVTKPVPFEVVPNAEPWVPSDEPTYLVVTGGNWSVYYSVPPEGSDFATYIYLVASLGLKPNPGYNIRILDVRLQDKVTVTVELREPDPRRFYPQVMVHPVAVVRVAKADLEPRGVLEFSFIDQKGIVLATLKADF